MTDDLKLMVEAAVEAGQIARARRQGGLEVQSKAGGSPVTDGDLVVNAFLTERLRQAQPDYGWLSEETADDPARLARARIFVVDPVDGTVAYIKGLPWWTVALAVVEHGEPVAAVVHAPDLDETYTAIRGRGAWLNGEAISASRTERLAGAAILADPALLGRPIWRHPWPELRLERRNSIAYRLALVGAGVFDAAISLGPKWDWDVVAGSLIATEGGAFVSDHGGRPLHFNQPVPQQASLICATPDLYPLILDQCGPIALTDPNDGMP